MADWLRTKTTSNLLPYILEHGHSYLPSQVFFRTYEGGYNNCPVSPSPCGPASKETEADVSPSASVPSPPSRTSNELATSFLPTKYPLGRSVEGPAIQAGASGALPSPSPLCPSPSFRRYQCGPRPLWSRVPPVPPRARWCPTLREATRGLATPPGARSTGALERLMPGRQPGPRGTHPGSPPLPQRRGSRHRRVAAGTAPGRVRLSQPPADSERVGASPPAPGTGPLDSARHGTARTPPIIQTLNPGTARLPSPPIHA